LSIQLPTTILVEFDARESVRTCNLLFTQSLQDKILLVSTNTSGNDWKPTKNVFVLGELVSVALDRKGCKALKLQVAANESFLSRTKDLVRPPFGLLEAWIASGKTRLP